MAFDFQVVSLPSATLRFPVVNVQAVTTSEITGYYMNLPRSSSLVVVTGDRSQHSSSIIGEINIKDKGDGKFSIPTDFVYLQGDAWLRFLLVGQVGQVKDKERSFRVSAHFDGEKVLRKRADNVPQLDFDRLTMFLGHESSVPMPLKMDISGMKMPRGTDHYQLSMGMGLMETAIGKMFWTKKGLLSIKTTLAQSNKRFVSRSSGDRVTITAILRAIGKGKEARVLAERRVSCFLGDFIKPPVDGKTWGHFINIDGDGSVNPLKPGEDIYFASSLVQ